MGIKVTYKYGVIVWEIQESTKIWRVTRWARRGRRDVDVENVNFAITEIGADGLELKGLISEGKGGSVNMCEGYGVVNQERKTSTPASQSILPD